MLGDKQKKKQRRRDDEQESVFGLLAFEISFRLLLWLLLLLQERELMITADQKDHARGNQQNGDQEEDAR